MIQVRAALVPLDGSPAIDIAKDMTLVGRKEDCDIRIDHKSISKVHCVLVKTDGLLLLRDLGSTNGTRVNSTRVRRAALLANDKVSFANFHFRVHLGPLEALAGPNEHTQAIDAQELQQMRDKAPPALGDSSLDEPILQVQVNALPDVYPEDERKKGK
jgi:pSer/pThr/pTyr-binding forkhead associated (FHA) protein